MSICTCPSLTVLASYTKHPTFLPPSFAGPNKNSTQLFLPLTQSTPLRNLPVLQDLGRRGKSQIAGQISTPQNAQMQTYLFTPQGGLLKRTLGWHGTLGSMKAQGWGYASLGSASLPSCTSLSACQPTTLQKSEGLPYSITPKKDGRAKSLVGPFGGLYLCLPACLPPWKMHGLAQRAGR